MTKRFSERLGIIQSHSTIQTEGMDDPLRNSLWNFIYLHYNLYWYTLAKLTAVLFQKQPVDDLPGPNSQLREWVKDYFFSLTWYEAYDFIEFLIEHDEQISGGRKRDRGELTRDCNMILERELSGFRFINSVFVQISNSTESSSISEAVSGSASAGLYGAHQHLNTALKLLAKKPEPDYRNSIKESISAVESACKQLGSSKSSGLAGALSDLQKHTPIHEALKQGFIKLYGYASDESGIRHPIINEPNVGFDEAKYMLVTCSAFVNYLVGKAANTPLLKDDSEKPS